jgi:hypothetical protein
MQWEPRYRFSIAPRFASPLAWAARLQVGRRDERSQQPDSTMPNWHPVSEAESALLVADETNDASWRRDVCLFAIPEHLRAKWWELAARQIETLPARIDGMEPFARAVLEFAQFKRVPLPRQCAFDVTLSSPLDEPTTPIAAVDFNPSSVAERTSANSPMMARINLGDERTALIFLNAARLNSDVESQSADGPLVRLILDPGEGVWLPNRDVVCTVDHTGKTDLDVWLILKDEGGRMKDEPE